ncbi:hypothetical protein HUJ05_012212 [Dendroctonus ponderosae]|nr:hypothetical protein HUJ05_012212 [Dendroctonus ponderosae]
MSNDLLETKIEIMDRLRNRARITDVARLYSMNEATIRTVRKNEDSIRKSVAAGASSNLKTISYKRDAIMENMEKALVIWIEDQTQKQVPIDSNALTNKAVKIYQLLMDQSRTTLPDEKNPLDQGIISAFKAMFMRQTFRYILEQMEKNESLTRIEALKKFTVLDCVKHIGMSYTQIKPTTINARWKALWPDVVERGEGFEDFAVTDIEEITSDEDLNEDDLINIINETTEDDEDNDSDQGQSEPVDFTARNIRRDLRKFLNQHEEVYKDLAEIPKQLLISDFMTKSGLPEVLPKLSDVEPQLHQESSSDENDILPIRKKRLMVHESDDSD